MDWIWITIGAILLVLGFIGSFAPFLAGPPLAYLALPALQLTSFSPFSQKTLILWGIATILITLLDYVIPIIGTRKFGGTKYGTRGSAIGLVIGFLFGPLGIIIGPFLGALIGELLGGKNLNYGLRSGLGSFFGFITSTLMKMIFVIALAIVFIRAIL
ncbi:MAG TPA: DUF456 domain-containing protein [Bacteroidales bacterium]|jgi:hypothetical protein|nr:DUF456 domain-containing protein [Bacteroidales bacterium]MDI9574462.1 DUF456 domain-containing protein [Bacteroidota bacterium]OQC59025.1 MAG: hypothetical protein BWX51_01766 [Bacteroidetes bacterium ADurb.Bin012]MBP9511378.1 DUF456 domain-containing protein [Bacteroidales bacterium]MBP9587618.1 DUF456 domain-containing protein [Bacteroidales bacterium]